MVNFHILAHQRVYRKNLPEWRKIINIKCGFAASTLPCHYNDWMIERVCLIIGAKILTKERKGKDRKRKLYSSVKSTCCSVKGTLIGDIVKLNLSQIKSCQVQVFEERGKPEYPGKNLSQQSREPTAVRHPLLNSVAAKSSGSPSYFQREKT